MATTSTSSRGDQRGSSQDLGQGPPAAQSSVLPVLPLSDTVLLPGMVIPVTLDSATQAAVDAARTADDNTLLAVPRLDGTYGSVGTIAVIERVGRLPSGEPAARARGLNRARIGRGV